MIEKNCTLSSLGRFICKIQPLTGKAHTIRGKLKQPRLITCVETGATRYRKTPSGSSGKHLARSRDKHAPPAQTTLRLVTAEVAMATPRVRGNHTPWAIDSEVWITPEYVSRLLILKARKAWACHYSNYWANKYDSITFICTSFVWSFFSGPCQFAHIRNKEWRVTRRVRLAFGFRSTCCEFESCIG